MKYNLRWIISTGCVSATSPTLEDRYEVDAYGRGLWSATLDLSNVAIADGPLEYCLRACELYEQAEGTPEQRKLAISGMLPVAPGADTVAPGADTVAPGADTVAPGADTVAPGVAPPSGEA